MRRLTRSRAATDDEATPQASGASEPVDATHDAQQGGSSMPVNGTAPATAEEPPTAVLAQDEPTAQAEPEVDRDLPAGVDPGELAAVPSSARRGRLRHRLRYLRAVRELLLRDIGGFYYEAQRAEDGVKPHQRLLDAKTARLTRLDEEMRDLETRLEAPHPETVLRVPGIGGTCPVCGEVHGSDARYCSRCGSPLGRRAAAAASAPATGATPAPASDEGKQTTASLWGRPKRPEPADPNDATMAVGDNSAAAGEPARAAGGEPAPASDDRVSDEAPAGSERS